MSKIVCSNCGATFDEKEPKCPFCGYICYSGAEDKFMADLGKIKDDMSDLSSIPNQEYRKQMSKQKKVIFITIIILAIIACLIGLLYFILYKVFDGNQGDYNVKDEMIWERENYPKLDSLYQQENYDAILGFQSRLYQTDNNHSLYNWKHYNFIQAYEKYKDTEEIIFYIDLGLEPSKYDIGCLVYECMWYHYKQFDETKDTYTEEDYRTILQYREEMENIFYNRLQFTDAEADNLYNECLDHGYMQSKPCYQYADKIYDRFK